MGLGFFVDQEATESVHDDFNGGKLEFFGD